MHILDTSGYSGSTSNCERCYEWTIAVSNAPAFVNVPESVRGVRHEIVVITVVNAVCHHIRLGTACRVAVHTSDEDRPRKNSPEEREYMRPGTSEGGVPNRLGRGRQ